jgi:hypothetical protein
MITPGFLFAFAGPLSQNEEKTSTPRYVTEGGRNYWALDTGNGRSATSTPRQLEALASRYDPAQHHIMAIDRLRGHR